MGWIVNLARPEESRAEDRPWQPPVFWFEDGVACFEVWFWCAAVARWFVMSHLADQQLAAQGVIYFSPTETPDDLRARVLAIDPTITWSS